MKIDVANSQRTSGNGSISINDFEIIKKRISYAMKDKNPVDSVSFYRKGNLNESFKIKPEDVSLLLPSKFSEIIIRVFVYD